MLRRAGGLGVALVAVVSLGLSDGGARADDVAFPRPDPVANGTFDAAPDIGVAPFWYASREGTTHFVDLDGNGDVEAVIDGAAVAATDAAVRPLRDLWQVAGPAHQNATLDFDTLAFTVERGTVPDGAAIRLGFALTPLFETHPFVGVFNEGSLVFRYRTPSDGAAPESTIAAGVLTGEIECRPDADGAVWEPCLRYQAAMAAAPDDAARRALLARARLVEIDLDGFSRIAPGEQVVLDNITITNDRTVAEVLAAGVVVPDPPPSAAQGHRT